MGWQDLFQTFVGCNYCTQFSALSFETNIFIKNDISLGGANKHNVLFSNVPPKMHPCPKCLE